MDFLTLAKKYNTPLYVYDFNHIKTQFETLKSAFSGKKSLICYAVKANSNLSLVQFLASLDSGADCVSIGEIKRAIKAGIKPYKIIFSGVGKSDEEIEEAIALDVLMINIESEAELWRIEDIGKKLGKNVRISIRVNPNIDPKTHPYISTGLHENKFGVDIESAKRLYIFAKNSQNLEPVGIHFHIGSQLTELEPIREASKIVAGLLKSLKALQIEIKFFDVGGGLGIVYDDEKTIEPKDYANAIFESLKGLDVTIVKEPGRFIVGNSGYFVTKVLYEKNNENKRFIIVDGAMNDLIRPTLYDAYHDAYILREIKDETGTLCDVVGPICESGDFFAKNIRLATTKHGDLIIIKSVGAYGFSMSSNYNTRGRVAEVAVYDGKDRLIRRRESFEDVVANEVEYML